MVNNGTAGDRARLAPSHCGSGLHRPAARISRAALESAKDADFAIGLAYGPRNLPEGFLLPFEQAHLLRLPAELALIQLPVRFADGGKTLFGCLSA